MTRREHDEQVNRVIEELGEDKAYGLTFVTHRIYTRFGFEPNPLRNRAFELVEATYGYLPSLMVRWLLLEGWRGLENDEGTGVGSRLPRGPMPVLFERASWPT